MAVTRPRPVLVLGVGNVLLGDEGVGVRVAEALATRDLPPSVEVADGATAGLGLVELLAGRRTVVIVDAVDAPGEPGSVLRLLPEELADPSPGLSVHELGVTEALHAARLLGVAPGEVVIYGVRPAEVGWGLELSRPVAAAVPLLVELVAAEATACAARASGGETCTG